jgi:preprotein translocase subunit SecE
MAKGQKDKQTPKVAEDGEPEEAGLAAPKETAPLAVEDEGDDPVGADNGPSEDADPSAALVAEGDADEAGDEFAATQLGTQRYVLAGFFATGMLLAYVFGKLIHGVWATASNKDWFSRALPTLAAVGDDEKMTYGTVVGGIIALGIVLRTYRNPEIRTWSDDVAAELAKVKWPTKKEVTNATFIVITATTVATIYLALLDRFWAFVTNIVYGDGS